MSNSLMGHDVTVATGGWYSVGGYHSFEEPRMEMIIRDGPVVDMDARSARAIARILLAAADIYDETERAMSRDNHP